MAFFDFFGRKRAEEEAKEEELKKAAAEQDSEAVRKAAHPKFAPPEIQPINSLKAGEEEAPRGEDSIGRERKEELCTLVWRSRIKYEEIRGLETQELLFLMTAMEQAQMECPLENYEENHQLLNSELLNRVRSADEICVLYDGTTGYPFLESGLCCIYLSGERAEQAAKMYAKQFRKLNAVKIPLTTVGEDGKRRSFMEYLGYLGMDWLLLDNGWYRARFRAGDVVNSIQWEEKPQEEVKNPKLFLAALNMAQEIRWPVNYEKRNEVLRRRQFEAYMALRTSRLIVPALSPEAAPDESGEDTRKEGETLRIPLVMNGEKKFFPVFTDPLEYVRSFEKKKEIRPIIMEYGKVIPLLSGKEGLIVNPGGLMLVFALPDLAGMENVIAAAAKKAAEQKTGAEDQPEAKA